jgi:hypothetical protein
VAEFHVDMLDKSGAIAFPDLTAYSKPVLDTRI